MELTAYHNSRIKKYRFPQGAVKCGEGISLVIDLAGVDADRCNVLLRLWSCAGETMIKGERQKNVFLPSFIFHFTAPETPQLIWYYFIIELNGKKCFYGGRSGKGEVSLNIPKDYQITVYDASFETPAWFTEAVVYQIFPDRFCRGSADKKGFTALERAEMQRKSGLKTVLHKNWNEEVLFKPLPGEKDYSPCDYYGGDLKGIEEKLPYLEKLGVKAIYLNPVFEAHSNHRYNTADYLSVDPILGENEDLKRLAGSAEKHGMRLILDGVFSHTGDDSIYFNRYGRYPSLGAYQSKDSPYYEWYDFRHYPDDYLCWWGFESLPEVNENTPSYMEFISKILKFLSEQGITSWRLDVADELPEEFIRFLRIKIKQLDPDGLILGEVWEDASNKEFSRGLRKYVYGHELDGVMNYPFRDAVCDFFTEKTDAFRFNDILAGQRERYPDMFYRSCLNVLGSHDCQRILSVLSGAPEKDTLSRDEQSRYSESPSELALGKKRLRAASALQFSMPQPPCIYYGDEAGMTGLSDPFNRRPFPWGNEDKLLTAHYMKLSSVRNESRALKSGKAAFTALNNDLFAVYRCAETENCIEAFLTVVNRSENAKKFTVSKADFTEGPDADAVFFQGEFIDLFSGEKYFSENGRLSVKINGNSFIMLRTKRMN